jgi:hypothetical protein
VSEENGVWQGGRGESITTTWGFLMVGEVKTTEIERGTRGPEGCICQGANSSPPKETAILGKKLKGNVLCGP